ncbi:unnamed protein product [Rotaria sp. Silwood2]|nr:unnamed protein product [Rotaria sp. Silwood2]CAF3389144.1 unnamed protein product [Rotaria sp. Silwood2]CAF4088784.1 unnamed protein product [Rotaria sp. Silwood2]CAF4375481.1 unnamed protein product [Rotaria sp. Silwood2]
MSETVEQTVNDVYKGIQESISTPETDTTAMHIPTNRYRHSSFSPSPPPPPPPRSSSRLPLPSSPSSRLPLPPPPPSRLPRRSLPPSSSEPPSPYAPPIQQYVEAAHTNICCACLYRRPQQNQHRMAQFDQHHTSASKQCLMISYNWDNQAICKKIYDHLRSDGYIVWFDVQNMHGCIYTAMAKAVEQSQTVLFGMTEKYRQSDNCRKELTYACKKRKRLIPLRLQEKYDPDGWLGLISAELLYIDFTKKDFDTNYQSLLKEIESSENVM